VFCAISFVVAAIAIGAVFGLATTTKCDGFVGVKFFDHGGETHGIVGPIAKRRVFGEPTGAVGHSLTSFDGDRVGFVFPVHKNPWLRGEKSKKYEFGQRVIRYLTNGWLVA